MQKFPERNCVNILVFVDVAFTTQILLRARLNIRILLLHCLSILCYGVMWSMSGVVSFRLVFCFTCPYTMNMGAIYSSQISVDIQRVMLL
jgi:hypothetical protein